MTKNELEETIKETLSAFFKICPICGQNFKDTLDMKIICINCERDQKINKVLENE